MEILEVVQLGWWPEEAIARLDLGKTSDDRSTIRPLSRLMKCMTFIYSVLIC